MSNYNSYHTNLVLLHNFNSLPDEFKSIIPNSTLSGWNNRNVAKIIGCDSLADNDINLLRQIVTSKKLLVAAKALYFVFSTRQIEFKVFLEQAGNDQFGLKTKLAGGNVASRVLPVKIHDLDNDDKQLHELGMC